MIVRGIDRKIRIILERSKHVFVGPQTKLLSHRVFRLCKRIVHVACKYGNVGTWPVETS
jgi:hypothetical protein